MHRLVVDDLMQLGGRGFPVDTFNELEPFRVGLALGGLADDPNVQIR